MGRRTFVRGAMLGAAGLGLPGLLSACGIDPAVQTPATCKSTDISDTDKKLVWSNWPQYIDKGKKTLLDFIDQTGIDVTYNADVNDNNEFFA
jgi:spermidine/putrescine transport system substrate-binding protein